jgi:hypothetical protein
MRRDVSGWGRRRKSVRRGPVSQRLSLFRRRRDGGRWRRRSTHGGLLLTHEPLEQRQMLAGTPSLTDAQYQARLATLNTEHAAALSGAAKAQEQADKTWQDAQSDSKAFYASWEEAAYYGGELPKTSTDSAPPEKVSGLLVSVVAADLTKAKEIGQAERAFGPRRKGFSPPSKERLGGPRLRSPWSTPQPMPPTSRRSIRPLSDCLPRRLLPQPSMTRS